MGKKDLMEGTGEATPHFSTNHSCKLLLFSNFIVSEFILPTAQTFNLLTPWSRVLLEKLTSFQPVKKFPTFYGTRRFITAFTSTRHLPLP